MDLGLYPLSRIYMSGINLSFKENIKWNIKWKK
jgi:hypothetical protein